MFSRRLFILPALLLIVPACNGSLNQGNKSGTVPSFGGATAAAPGANPGEVALTWSPALSLSGGSITYLVYASLSGSGTEDLSSPVATTTNSTGMTVSGLTSHDQYWFIVQAFDSSGGQDSNTAEVSATPP